MKDTSDQHKGTGRKQIVGNIGLYYVCYELSKRWWNTMPTSRNARGIDVLIYSQNGKDSHTVQVKSLSKKIPVPVGGSLENLIADFILIVTNVLESPNIFIVDNATAKPRIKEQIKNGKKSYWFEVNDYKEFKDNWSIIGNGATNN